MSVVLIVLDEFLDTLDLASESADLRAQFLGFSDASEMKGWGEQAEDDRLAVQASIKGAD